MTNQDSEATGAEAFAREVISDAKGDMWLGLKRVDRLAACFAAGDEKREQELAKLFRTTLLAFSST
jgi:hypothetical protein